MHSNMRTALRVAVVPFENPSLGLGILQLVTSIGLYLATIAAMYWGLQVSYWLTLALGLP